VRGVGREHPDVEAQLLGSERAAVPEERARGVAGVVRHLVRAHDGVAAHGRTVAAAAYASSAVLAYVFWHAPAPDAGGADHEERLVAFHAALRAAPEPGFGVTAAFGLDAVPWLGGAAGYEDWYLVEDFAALGRLNAAAVAGARRAPHDAAAAQAAAGTAGVMAHVAGRPWPEGPAWAAWTSKPAGLPYRDAHAALAAAVADRDASAWQRQMTLGPATEYCVLAAAPLALPWPAAHAWPLRPVA
jgi:hypothetical protein